MNNMEGQMTRRQRSGTGKRIGSWIVSMFLVICSILCVFTIVQTASNRRMSVMGYSFFYVMTGSMEPTIHTYSEIITRKVDAEDLKVGDIITFESYDPTIVGYTQTHRIIEIIYQEQEHKYYFQTKGDANNMADDRLVAEEDICGRVIFHTGSLRFMSRLLRFLGTPLGILTLVVIPVAVIVVLLALDFRKEYLAIMEEDEEEAKMAEQKRIEELKEQLKEEMKEQLEAAEGENNNGK